MQIVHELLADYGPVIVPWAISALAAVAAWLLARLGAGHVVRSVFGELGAHARDVVQEVWQVYVEQIKASRVDGQLTAQEALAARDMAIARLKQRLSWRKLIALGGGWLSRIFGGSKWGAKLSDILGGAVETAVAESKREGKTAGLKTSGKGTTVRELPLPAPPPEAEPEEPTGPRHPPSAR